MTITYIIALFLLILAVEFLRGVYDYRHWDNTKKKYIYESKDRVPVNFMVYFILCVSFLLPILNLLIPFATIVETLAKAREEGYYLHIPWLSWLDREI